LIDHLDLSFEVTAAMLNGTKNQTKNDDKTKKSVGDIGSVEVDSSVLFIEVWDSVVGYDSLIGSGSVSIRNVCLFNGSVNNTTKDGKIDQEGRNRINDMHQNTGEKMELTADLVTKKNEPVGRVVLYVVKKEIQSISVAAPFTSEDDLRLRGFFEVMTIRTSLYFNDYEYYVFFSICVDMCIKMCLYAY
jgi:hypothetical protein